MEGGELGVEGELAEGGGGTRKGHISPSRLLATVVKKVMWLC